MSTPPRMRRGIDLVEPGVVMSDPAHEWFYSPSAHSTIAGLDKEKRREEERNVDRSEIIQPLDPPFPYRTKSFDPFFFNLE